MKSHLSQRSQTVSGFHGGASYSAPSDETHRRPTERWEWNRPETPQERWLRLRPYAEYEPSMQHSGSVKMGPRAFYEGKRTSRRRPKVIFGGELTGCSRRSAERTPTTLVLPQQPPTAPGLQPEPARALELKPKPQLQQGYDPFRPPTSRAQRPPKGLESQPSEVIRRWWGVWFTLQDQPLPLQQECPERSLPPQQEFQDEPLPPLLECTERLLPPLRECLDEPLPPLLECTERLLPPLPPPTPV
ncbi:hypothetical protein DPEC_G00024310 [Dallia pectoralis]|uniref:Uncharacterized protein n=1 Tax=Dallia pectoralis TaxID=75939 RepID=A0ACC2HIH1_DALPE|nr:hypothetical protein DPEC_G00024310 [Dallia pectoralis]